MLQNLVTHVQVQDVLHRVTQKPGTSLVRTPLYTATCIVFTPYFTVVYIVEQLVSNTIYLLSKEILQFLGMKSAVYNHKGFQIKSRL